MPRKRLFCQENDTRSGRRFASRLYPSHGPLRFITSHSFRARLCHAKNEAPEEQAVAAAFSMIRVTLLAFHGQKFRGCLKPYHPLKDCVLSTVLVLATGTQCGSSAAHPFPLRVDKASICFLFSGV